MSKKILYIEDDKILGSAFKIKMSGTDYEVQHAGSVEEAEKLNDFVADVLLVDHGLPGKQGIDAIPDLKKIFPQAKIIIYSNFDDDKHIEKAQQNGADDYWVKFQTPIKKVIQQIQAILTN